MSFDPKNELVRQQALRVQELCLTNQDSSLFSDLGSDHAFLIREPVDKVLLVMQKDDSANALVHFAASSISIVDSSAFTAGGDMKAIRVNGLASIDANDCIIIKYIAK